ncbi:DUS1L [Symbiodinium microadriaticum]|nr:DUS1L [Symbiodinium microadriaticum]
MAVRPAQNVQIVQVRRGKRQRFERYGVEKRARVSGKDALCPSLVPKPRFELPPHRYVLAPMVGGSELPFRMMTRQFGAQLCYTPMIYSGPFSTDADYRAAPENGFQTCPEDRPLVAHFCGNDPEVLLAAARHIADRVDAIDLNLGCPQRVAHAEHFGAYLLEKKDRGLVCSIVKRLSEALPVPVFCKIRLLDELEETLELVKQLEASGASLIAVHARYRGTPTHRRDGPAHLDQVRAIKKVVRVPILSNGNIKSWGDVVANLELTQADGVMSAEGMLDDPCIFAGSCDVDSKKALRKVEKKLRQVQKLLERQASGAPLNAEELQKVATRKQLRKERKSFSSSREVEEDVQVRVPTDGLAKARVYLDYVSRFTPAPPLSTIIFHCRRMAKAELTEFQLLEDFKSSKSFQVRPADISAAEAFKRSPGSFKASKEKERRDRELRAQQAYEVECRRKYEQRMARKAARLGLPLEEVMRASAVPGGVLHFNGEPSWLAEKGEEISTRTESLLMLDHSAWEAVSKCKAHLNAESAYSACRMPGRDGDQPARRTSKPKR